MEERIKDLEERYGKEWESASPVDGGVIRRKGIPIVSALIDRVSRVWMDEEEEEFKIMFLLTTLHMVLCPTQSMILASDLLPAITCSMNAFEYDWATLVLEKLMVSVRAFARRFYVDGYASGCGGCTLFLAVLYLNRLNRNPVHWGIGSRIQVWTTTEVRRACKDDQR